jgi:hypothetical protein
VSLPLPSSSPSAAKSDGLFARSPAPAVATPAAVNPFFTNDRLLIAAFMLLHIGSIGPPQAKEAWTDGTDQVSAGGKKIVICLLLGNPNSQADHVLLAA